MRANDLCINGTMPDDLIKEETTQRVDPIPLRKSAEKGQPRAIPELSKHQPHQQPQQYHATHHP
ncbi:hypothetical protein DPMN_008625 [Dreissena polymorpha]|uniref:Uncharacterized protein n=1 Tax=Dreissena polymorpha TaxID=45954 RepID=A0A9D4RX59_DREPO|nr:hypothetical protein DPMN_008625 [Dreissena polymorpha]